MKIQNFKQKIYNFLRWTQKYTKTDMVYLAKGGFWLTLGGIISSVLVFLLAIAFANLLPQETFGIYKYVLSIFSILLIFTLPQMGTAITQATARGYEGAFIPAVKEKIRWGILGAIGCLGLAGYYYFNDNLTLAVCFFIAAIFLPLFDAFNIYGFFLQGRKLFKVSTKYGVIFRLLTTIMTIIVLFLTKNIFLILLAHFFFRILITFIFFKVTLKVFPPTKKRDMSTIPYGRYLSFISIIHLIAEQLDKILIWHFLGPVQVAVYTFGIIPFQQTQGLFKSIGTLAFPKLSQKPLQELKVNLPKKIFQFFLLLVPVVIVFILIIPFFYKIFFPKYIESIFYSQIAILILLFFPGFLLGKAIVAKMKEKEIAISSLSYSVARIILLIILTPLYGIIGAISALLIASALNFALLFFLFKRM